jgi:hypothetical protein
MMTISELESACDASQPPDLSRYAFDAPELSLRGMYYPLGFPVELRTNSSEILRQARCQWSMFEHRFQTEPIQVDIHVTASDSKECPPIPEFRILYPLLVNMADPDNFSIVDLKRNRTQITISQAAERHSSYLRYFFLGASPLCHIATRYTTPVHAACVAMNGCGMLLCGDSGAGKSSLSYACARVGCTYVSDDASYLINDSSDRLVTGNCHQIRFRPSAAELFPEVEGLEITPRAMGKPSIEMPIASMPHITAAETARVDFMIFLNRSGNGAQEIRPYRRDVARYFARQVLYGSPETQAMQHQTIERLLTAEILELRYTNLDWAVNRLQMLLRGAG